VGFGIFLEPFANIADKLSVKFCGSSLELSEESFGCRIVNAEFLCSLDRC